MRVLLISICTALWASAAVAQEAVRIPFSPTIPSTFALEEVRTITLTDEEGEQTASLHAEYQLEFRRRGSAWDTVWTVRSSEWTGAVPEFVPDPTHWVGIPITLSLDETGNPATVNNWDDIRGILNGQEDLRSTMLANMPSERAADILAFPLTVISPCHNTNQVVGVPARAEQDNASEPTFVRVAKELNSIDHAGQTARVVFERVQGIRSSGQNTTVRADCVIDLRSGVTRSAVTSTVSAEGQSAIEVRSDVSLAQQ